MDNNNPSHVGYWVGGIIVVIAIIGGIVLWRSNTAVTSGTGTPTGTTSSPTTVVPYGTVTLGFGQSASFDGITITPLTLAEDSRCAVDVQCIQAGTVRIAVRSDLDSGASRQDTLTLGTAANIDRFVVTLTTVTPDKKSTVTIGNGDYRFTFEVHQNGSGADTGLEGKG